MTVAVCLLRAVNVGGHNLVAMSALRETFETLGFESVRTYVQSGNVVFRAPKRTTAALAAQIEKALEARFGFHCDVVVRTSGELRKVVEENPFAGRTDVEPARLVAVFLRGTPTAEAREKALAIRVGPEELRAGERELYVHYADGMGRSKLTPALLDKALGVKGTARNWNTVRKLLEMAEQIESR